MRLTNNTYVVLTKGQGSFQRAKMLQKIKFLNVSHFRQFSSRNNEPASYWKKSFVSYPWISND